MKLGLTHFPESSVFELSEICRSSKLTIAVAGGKVTDFEDLACRT